MLITANEEVKLSDVGLGVKLAAEKANTFSLTTFRGYGYPRLINVESAQCLDNDYHVCQHEST